MDKVIQSGTPHEMFNKPSSPFIHHFIGEANFIRGKISEKWAGGCKIVDNIGRIFTTNATFLDVGSNAVAGIKTEFTLLEKEQKDDVNTFMGTVDRKLFLGRFTDFEIIMEDGGIVHARLPSSIIHKFDEGSKVYVHYSPERLLVFPEPEKGLKAELEMM